LIALPSAPLQIILAKIIVGKKTPHCCGVNHQTKTEKEIAKEEALRKFLSTHCITFLGIYPINIGF
jgi:hypothetical protein